MTIKTKKEIAREGLILLGYLIIVVICFVIDSNDSPIEILTDSCYAPQIFLWILAYLAIRFIIWAIKTLRNKPLSSKQKIDKKPKVNNKNLTGIGGWLLFFSITAVLGWVVGLIGYISYFVAPVDLNIFLLLSESAMLLLYSSALLLFFQEKRIAPKLFIIAFVLNVLYKLFLTITFGLPITERGGIMHAIVFASIWIPYFIHSKRVKNTFVKP